jgi:hypothetical protein
MFVGFVAVTLSVIALVLLSSAHSESATQHDVGGLRADTQFGRWQRFPAKNAMS